MDIFMIESVRRIGDDDVLSKIDKLLNWDAFLLI